jgi:hypothetical protein
MLGGVMPFSPTFIAEIDKEVAGLRALRDKIDERIRSLEAVKRPLDIGPSSRQLELIPPGQDQGQPATFRSMVRAALRATGPARAPQVAKRLEANGFKNDSPTRLAVRVYNDLWRMAQSGGAKVDGGVFTLVD